MSSRLFLMLFVSLGALSCQSSVHADPAVAGAPDGVNPVIFVPQVPFAENADISTAVREQCGLNEAMVASIQGFARDYKVPLVSAAQEGVPSGMKVRRLSAEITHVIPGVYAFFHWSTTPAVLVVHFRLTEGDDVLLDTQRRCTSRKAGFLGLDGRACSRLIRCTEEQGDYIGKLVKKKFY